MNTEKQVSNIEKMAVFGQFSATDFLNTVYTVFGGLKNVALTSVPDPDGGFGVLPTAAIDASKPWNGWVGPIRKDGEPGAGTYFVVNPAHTAKVAGIKWFAYRDSRIGATGAMYPTPGVLSLESDADGIDAQLDAIAAFESATGLRFAALVHSGDMRSESIAAANLADSEIPVPGKSVHAHLVGTGEYADYKLLLKWVQAIFRSDQSVGDKNQLMRLGGVVGYRSRKASEAPHNVRIQTVLRLDTKPTVVTWKTALTAVKAYANRVFGITTVDEVDAALVAITTANQIRRTLKDFKLEPWRVTCLTAIADALWETRAYTPEQLDFKNLLPGLLIRHDGTAMPLSPVPFGSIQSANGQVLLPGDTMIRTKDGGSFRYDQMAEAHKGTDKVVVYDPNGYDSNPSAVYFTSTNTIFSNFCGGRTTYGMIRQKARKAPKTAPGSGSGGLGTTVPTDVANELARRGYSPDKAGAIKAHGDLKRNMARNTEDKKNRDREADFYADKVAARNEAIKLDAEALMEARKAQAEALDPDVVAYARSVKMSLVKHFAPAVRDYYKSKGVFKTKNHVCGFFRSMGPATGLTSHIRHKDCLSFKCPKCAPYLTSLRLAAIAGQPVTVDGKIVGRSFMERSVYRYDVTGGDKGLASWVAGFNADVKTLNSVQGNSYNYYDPEPKISPEPTEAHAYVAFRLSNGGYSILTTLDRSGLRQRATRGSSPMASFDGVGVLDEVLRLGLEAHNVIALMPIENPDGEIIQPDPVLADSRCISSSRNLTLNPDKILKAATVHEYVVFVHKCVSPGKAATMAKFMGVPVKEQDDMNLDTDTLTPDQFVAWSEAIAVQDDESDPESVTQTVLDTKNPLNNATPPDTWVKSVACKPWIAPDYDMLLDGFGIDAPAANHEDPRTLLTLSEN